MRLMSNTVSKGRKMVAKFNGRCPACECAIVAGTEVVFYADHAPGRKVLHTDCARARALPSRIWAHFLRANRDGMYEAHDLEQCRKLEAELEQCRASIAARQAA